MIQNPKHVISIFSGLRPNELILPGYEWMINHTSEGCFYPHGGPSEVPFQMIPIIEGYGGRVFVDASITRILVDSNGRANGSYIHLIDYFLCEPRHEISQQFDILTSVDSDQLLQPHFKLRNSKWCSVSSLTIIKYSSD